MAQKKINVDIILQSVRPVRASKDVTFTVPLGRRRNRRWPSCVEENLPARIGGRDIKLWTQDVAKVAHRGRGHAEPFRRGVSRMFEALYEANVNIRMISTSEIKISVIIDQAEADRAVAAIHSAFIH